ncbi:MAG: family 1 encapsulin nanocompartment shell protein [Solirubrobacteraceae bacterium]
MNHLLRAHAPISDRAWEQIDQEARERLEPALAARKLVDFAGPLGWEHSAANLGRTTALPGSPAPGAWGLLRQVLPVVELRADFVVAREELRDIDRGAADADFGALDNAAQQIAIAENAAVLSGWPNAIRGVAEASPYPRQPLGQAPGHYPQHIARAVDDLRTRGVGGPYGLALAPEPYRLALQTAEHGGALLTKHLETILGGGPIVWTPGLEGAIVISLRGGDFILECGQDLSVGYDSHDATQVELYIQESFSFRVATPEAAVVLGP